METKCYATKQPRDHGRNKKRNKNYLETNDSKIRKTQILWDAAKAVQKGNLQQYNPTSRNNKNL